MLWEISNPSDAYTMEAPSLQIAACAVFMLGRGCFGATCEESDLRVPIFIFGGAEDWAKENGMPDLGDYITEHREEVPLRSIAFSSAIRTSAKASKPPWSKSRIRRSARRPDSLGKTRSARP
jgi:hypothetical protein